FTFFSWIKSSLDIFQMLQVRIGDCRYRLIVIIDDSNIPFTGKYARNKSAVFKDLSASFNPFTAFNASALERSVSFSNKIRLNEKYINMLRRMSNKINIPAVYTFIFAFSFIFPPSVHSQPLELCE